MSQAKEIYKNRIKKCLWCSREYKYFPYEEKTTKYCSRSCLAKMSMTGKKHTKESIEKMRQAKKGKVVSQQTREKISWTLKEKHKKGIIKTAFTIGHKAFPLTEIGRKKISISVSGANNHNWKGGKYKTLRKQAKIRDNYTCQICGLKDPEIVEIDHIKMKSEFPDEVNSLKNLITLCPNCHRLKTNSDLRRLNTGRLLPTIKYV